MSPLKDTQPVASNPGADTTTLPPVKPTAASTIDGSENLPAHVQRDWTEIQKRGHLGSGIFDEQKAPPSRGNPKASGTSGTESEM